MQVAQQTESVSNRHLMSYSLLAFPLAFAGLPLYINAPDFYSRELGVSLGVIGMVLLLIRLFDAIQDPLIGYVSDKFAHQRLNIVITGACLLLVGMGSVFIGPIADVSTVTWFAVSMLMATTGFSIVTINFTMIGSFWFDNDQIRTKVAAWRESVGLIGLLIAAVLPSILMSIWDVAVAYQLVVFTFSLCLIVAMLFFYGFYRSLSEQHTVKTTRSSQPFTFIRLLFGQQKRFFLSYFLSQLAASLPAVMVLFFINDYLRAEKLTGLFLFIYFVAGAACMPLWVSLAKRVGKQKTWLLAMLLSIVTFLGATLLTRDAWIAYAVICGLSGIALGADLALPPAILADKINDAHSESQATQFYGVLALLPKLAVAICSGLAFIALDIVGFVAGSDNSASVLNAVVIIYAFIPCLIKLLAAWCLWSLMSGDDNEKSKTNSVIGSNHHA